MAIRRRLLSLLGRDEGAAEILEFLAVLPILLFMGMLIWQLFIGGHAIVVGANAAREGARVLASCRGTDGDAVRQAVSAAPEFDVSVTPRSASCGGQVEVTVQVQVPSVVGKWLGSGNSGTFPIRTRSVMRKECCKDR